jgi:sterol desaturase/sphingolipid hydroxylase (fatty acid hydroxylase superfamily)
VSSFDPALLFVIGLGLLIIILELVRPDRPAQYRRWAVNGALGLISLVIPRLLLAVAPIGAAAWASDQGFGLFNMLSPPVLVVGLATIILMDLAVYWQHRAFHRVDWLWRWHRLHHEDAALDMSTGVRFHPVEALLSMVWKSACVAVLGAPVWAVPLFEAWLIAGSLIEHGNVKLPSAIDRLLRQFLVTPAMHRVHHSAHDDDANHNFSFAISLWDRWFGTYREIESGPRIGLT